MNQHTSLINEDDSGSLHNEYTTQQAANVHCSSAESKDPSSKESSITVSRCNCEHETGQNTSAESLTDSETDTSNFNIKVCNQSSANENWDPTLTVISMDTGDTTHPCGITQTGDSTHTEGSTDTSGVTDTGGNTYQRVVDVTVSNNCYSECTGSTDMCIYINDLQLPLESTGSTQERCSLNLSNMNHQW